MQDVLTMVEQLKRPALLVRSARMGLDLYNRGPHLGRILGPGPLPRHAAAILALLEREEELDTARRAHAATYALAEHVECLIALMGEARLLSAMRAAPQENASGIEALRSAT